MQSLIDNLDQIFNFNLVITETLHTNVDIHFNPGIIEGYQI